MVMNDADRALETEFARPARDDQGVLRPADRASQHRIDRDIELGALGQQTKFLIQNLKAFFRDVVRVDVINADLKVIKALAVQPLDALGGEQVAVGDQRGDDAMTANAPDDYFEFGVEERLAAAESNGHCAQ